jgi:transposase
MHKKRGNKVEVEITRLDHLGIVAGVIKDLQIIEQIDSLLGVEDEEKISHGEAIAGMVLNGLGFTARPLMLTEQYFENKPVDILIGEHAKPEHFNRFKLGRALDRVAAYGVEKLFYSVALHACQRENVDMGVAYNDTTSYSVEGSYDVEEDLGKITIKHGHSKDKRPDLKQIVQELITTQDGGIPFITKNFSGNASDSVIFRERAKLLIDEFARSGSRCLVMDSKAYAKETAETLNKINFITRVPATIKLEQETISKALAHPATWTKVDEHGYKFQEYDVDNYDIDDQRWIVVYSEQSRTQAISTLHKKVEKQKTQIDAAVARLQKKHFSCAADAQRAVVELASKFSYHSISAGAVSTYAKDADSGKSKAEQICSELLYQIEAIVTVNQHAIDATLDQYSCFVLATNLSKIDKATPDVLVAYKGLDKTEKGFAFLKNPEFFTSSFYLKKTSRIDALLMIMVLALLVYSIAQRHLRVQLKKAAATVPNQIKQPTSTPTMRWIFQIFEGISVATITLPDAVSVLVHGLNDLRRHILSFLSPSIQSIYLFSP